MMYDRKKLCRKLIVIALFVVFAFEYHILWDRFVPLIMHTERSVTHIEPSGTNTHAKVTFLQTKAKKNIIQPKRDFVNVSILGKKVFCC